MFKPSIIPLKDARFDLFRRLACIAFAHSLSVCISLVRKFKIYGSNWRFSAIVSKPRSIQNSRSLNTKTFRQEIEWTQSARPGAQHSFSECD